jgi:hypothetical protein
MAQSIQSGRFGHIGRLTMPGSQNRKASRSSKPDTHHHLWNRHGWTYLLQELLADLNTGHNRYQRHPYPQRDTELQAAQQLAATRHR